MVSASLTFAFALALFLTRRARADPVDVAFASDVSVDAASLSRTLVSFSIEQDHWTKWSGTFARNHFVFNVLDNLKAKTGSPPLIRIGANSEDRTIFDSSVQFSVSHFPPHTKIVPYPESTHNRVSDSFYQTARFLPPDTHIIWGVNLGQRNISAATHEARAIFKAFSTDAFKDAGLVLDAIEIGNEADLYKLHHGRPSDYSISDYLHEWSVFASAVSDVAHITDASHTKFWIGSFSTHAKTGFSPHALFKHGLPKSTLVSTYSQHHYSGSFCRGAPSLLQDLMSKDNIRGDLSAFASDIASVRSHGLHYVLGETNSYKCHGAPGVSNTAGAALWTLDYALFAATIGVSRLFFHEGVGYKYNLIQPVTLTRSILDGEPLAEPLAPHVQPQYYAAIIIAEATGKSGNVQLKEIQIDNPNIAGYAFYEKGKLRRAVFINSKAFFKGRQRRTTHITLNFQSSKYQRVHVKRLRIRHADDTSGLTWGGQSYETSDGRVSGTEHEEVWPISDGVHIRETEAVCTKPMSIRKRHHGKCLETWDADNFQNNFMTSLLESSSDKIFG
ncbi:hypothetical protein APHAL10511_002455 [Amanita phalloides]|nr:hypothetical protein APHAL10511_002455 [Amanita phalloides]